ncbi:11650_t:CDS:2 [Ambispora gerdemannii]|uniref:11650_t:CDS:1 n=1 Tax=Ambispora gerdemannii TaxID=144530 RepID=A0A9N9FWQ7_9GLOM|nr:11650_t:CDS:2 [Ambispora gerdemannii]
MKTRLKPTILEMQLESNTESQNQEHHPQPAVTSAKSFWSIFPGTVCREAWNRDEGGTIDARYTGNIGVLLYNNSTLLYVIRPNERIIQTVFLKRRKELGEKNRGNANLGYTGCDELETWIKIE